MRIKIISQKGGDFMGPVELRELANRVNRLEDRMNRYESWREDVERRLKKQSEPENEKPRQRVKKEKD